MYYGMVLVCTIFMTPSLYVCHFIYIFMTCITHIGIGASIEKKHSHSYYNLYTQYSCITVNACMMQSGNNTCQGNHKSNSVGNFFAVDSYTI